MRFQEPYRIRRLWVEVDGETGHLLVSLCLLKVPVEDISVLHSVIVPVIATDCIETDREAAETRKRSRN